MDLLLKKLNELELSQDQIDEIEKIVTGMLLNTGTKKPNIYNDAGELTEKWCSKHQMYHSVEHFPKSRSSKDGLYSHCRFAERRAKYYAKLIKQLKEKVFMAMSQDQEVDMKAITKQIDQLKVKAKQFDWEADSAVPINGKYEG